MGIVPRIAARGNVLAALAEYLPGSATDIILFLSAQHLPPTLATPAFAPTLQRRPAMKTKLKLDYRKTFLIGFGFLGTSIM